MPFHYKKIQVNAEAPETLSQYVTAYLQSNPQEAEGSSGCIFRFRNDFLTGIIHLHLLKLVGYT